jgi:dCMP deaminase
MNEKPRPGRDEYYMGIAMAVRARANCRGNKVGALIVVGDRVVSTGYNGTPSGMTNCLDGGCERCANREKYKSGTSYDLCICVHAEQNALLSAARFGIAVQGGVMYSTTRPCFGCTKELLQAGIDQVVYLHDWRYPDDAVQDAYEKIQNRVPRGMKKIDMPDPDADWAVSARREGVRLEATPVDPDDGHPVDRVQMRDE